MHFVGVGSGVVVAARSLCWCCRGWLKRLDQKACSGSVVHFINAEGDFWDVKSVGLFSLARIV